MLISDLRMWTRRNSLDPISPDKQREKPRESGSKLHNSRQSDAPKRDRVYCESGNHKSIDCDSVTNVYERKGLLAKKRLFFNCTGSKHRATNCNVSNPVQNVEEDITHQFVVKRRCQRRVC